MSRKLELGLTPREMHVARLVSEGLTDREVGERLFITRRTAEWHLKQIFNKLGFNSRSQVAAWVARDQAVGSAAESSTAHRQNLPLQLTTFVGRINQLSEIQNLLATKRLVTLTAVGGAGKTRLALEVAGRARDAFPDGTWFVDLTLAKDGHQISRVFGSALGVHEMPRQPMAETVIQHLSGRHLLLVVDNCEHVIDDCAGLVDTILRSCPDVALLATSREPLRVRGETVWPVPLLAVPDAAASIDLHELPECEAVALFLDRAHLTANKFELSAENASAVAELCRRLDGIPLAIELAAARIGLMSPDQMLERLEDRFGLLTSGSRTSPTRHRTLQSALDWSHDLLGERERTLFRRLSVFAGGSSLEAIEQVCSGADLEVAAITGLLGSLVDKSLVIATGEGSASMRFRMLETMHQFARKRLAESGEMELLSSRHAEFFVSLAEEASPHLESSDQQSSYRRLAQEIGNLRLALESTTGREPEANLRLSAALTVLWYLHGLVQEGDGWLNRALAGYVVRNELRARALGDAGQMSYWRDDVESASTRWHECLDIYRELADRNGIAWGLRWVGEATEWQGDLETARTYYDDALALATAAEDSRLIGSILRHLGRLAMKAGDHDRARTYLEESISHFERIGDERPINFALGYLGLNAVESGNFAAARSHLEQAIDIAHTLDFTIGVATPLMYFAALAAAQSYPVRALHLAGAAEGLAASAGAASTRLTRPLVERWLDQSRRTLGRKRSAARWAEGRAMSRQQATEIALTSWTHDRGRAKKPASAAVS
jgi:predicted ATPase/DNA-binding CsgD family transcriptional regulator